MSARAGAVAVLPMDVSGLGADGPRARAALLQALRTTLKGDLRVVPDDAVADVAACRADPACIARVAGDDADDVLFVRVDRAHGSPDLWGHATFDVVQPRAGRSLALEAPLTTTSADRDVRGLVLRAFDPARYVGRLDVVGAGADAVVIVDGLPTGGATLRLRPGAHVVTVLRADGTEVERRCEVALDERVQVDVGASSPAVGARSSPPRPWWPLATHAGVVVASTAGGVAVLANGIPRDGAGVAGISLSAAFAVVATAAGVAAGIEALRLVEDAQRATTPAAPSPALANDEARRAARDGERR